MSAPQQKLKILALHGHAMSGELLKAKIGAIRQDTKKLADWFFPDAPIAIPNADAFIQKDAQKQPQQEEATATATEEEGTTAEPQQQQIYSWYDFSKVSHALSQGLDLHKPCSIEDVKEPLYSGMGEAMQYLGKYAEENGPFDVIFSFSQGTILAALIVCQMNYERRLLANGNDRGTPSSSEVETLVSRLPKVPGLLAQPVKAAIFASGLPAKDPFYTQILKHPGFAALPPLAHSSSTSTPATDGEAVPPAVPVVHQIQSLHLWGLSDDIISPEWSKQLMSYPVFCGEVPSASNTDPAQEDLKLEHTYKKVVECPSGLVQYACHDGGHVVASTLRKPIKAFLQGCTASDGAATEKKKPAKTSKKEKKPKAEVPVKQQEDDQK